MEKNLINKKKALANINNFFNGRNGVIKFVDVFGSMILEAKRKAAEEPKPEPTKTKTKHKKSPFELHEKNYKSN